jgi:hypothetical protein
MVTEDETGEPRKVVFRGGINVPSGRRWPHRWNATIPSGRLTFSPQRVMLGTCWLTMSSRDLARPRDRCAAHPREVNYRLYLRR